ncbi:hypothetical protein [Pseudoalteromonas ardens]|uniref:Outer membrane protein beta-barrel domain-containing protein n=1 Tax=Pseudoalteromonas rubra TaxID=43658 RepID=A0A0L0EPT5_9GAMM|nr:hypothetical protein [Pseudoalteromonas sp. R96]KNC65908.1 hypothetical protein AC626_20250 [Pseudoalteromonas rubra]MDK1313955.1 hypothetical protein [Pseudoalteromonas sp. R96]
MKKTYHLALGLVAVSFINTAQAELSVGAGYPYGGLIGVQYTNAVNDDHLVSISAGLIGAAISYEYILDKDNKHTLGVITGSEAFTSEKGFAALNYHYYSQGALQEGWTFGASVGVRRTDEREYRTDILDIFGTEKVQSKTLIGLHIGYRF